MRLIIQGSYACVGSRSFESPTALAAGQGGGDSPSPDSSGGRGGAHLVPERFDHGRHKQRGRQRARDRAGAHDLRLVAQRHRVRDRHQAHDVPPHLLHGHQRHRQHLRHRRRSAMRPRGVQARVGSGHAAHQGCARVLESSHAVQHN